MSARAAGMNGDAVGATAEYVYTARRNNSLSSSGRLLAFGSILTVSLGIAGAFALILGAWPIMPYAVVEMAVLYAAFRYIERHAGDCECITIRGESVSVEVREGKNVRRFEFQRYWVQVASEPNGSRLALRSHGREVEVGRHLSESERADMARELARELRGAA